LDGWRATFRERRGASPIANSGVRGSRAGDGFVLRFVEGNYREATLSDQWGIGEQGIGFDLCQGDGLCERLARFDLNFWTFRIGGIDGDYRSGAYRAFVLAGFVNDQAIAGLHPTKISQSDRIGDAVPLCGAIALQVGEGIFGGFGLEKIVGHGSSIQILSEK